MADFSYLGIDMQKEETERKHRLEVRSNAISSKKKDIDTRNANINSKVSALSFGGVLKFVFYILLLSLLVRSLLDLDMITFKSFIENVIGNESIIDLSSVMELFDLQIIGDWGFANFLRDFLNSFVLLPLRGGAILFTLLFNGLSYILSFVSWIFFA